MNDERYIIEVKAESVYISDQSSPEDNHYVFAYKVVIRNAGIVAARLHTRHWIITDSNGKVQEVRGDGVVGEQPYLKPGEEISYTSAAVLETPVGSMHGSYQMVAEDGEQFDANIPAFGLAVPKIMH